MPQQPKNEKTPHAPNDPHEPAKGSNQPEGGAPNTGLVPDSPADPVTTVVKPADTKHLHADEAGRGGPKGPQPGDPAYGVPTAGHPSSSEYREGDFPAAPARGKRGGRLVAMTNIRGAKDIAPGTEVNEGDYSPEEIQRLIAAGALKREG